MTTDDARLAEVVRALGNYGSAKKYVFRYQGRNSRLDEVQAAVLSVKLRHLDEANFRRKQLAHYYYEHIVNPLVTLPRWLPDEQNVYHIFPVLCRERDQLQQALAARGIETLTHYPIPPHRQECYPAWAGCSLPVTEQIHREELSLPLSQVLTDNEAAFIAEAINDFKDILTC